MQSKQQKHGHGQPDSDSAVQRSTAPRLQMKRFTKQLSFAESAQLLAPSSSPALVQRKSLKSLPYEESTHILSPKASLGSNVTSNVQQKPDIASAVGRASSASGEPLPPDLQRRFGHSVGADLSGVRVHTGAQSAEAAAAMGARAYTMGPDIHFNSNQYQPASSEGQELIAHEVAHTVQQGASPTAHRQAKLAVTKPGDAAEQEADGAARAMVRGEAAQVSHSAPIIARGKEKKTRPLAADMLSDSYFNVDPGTVSYQVFEDGVVAKCSKVAMYGWTTLDTSELKGGTAVQVGVAQTVVSVDRCCHYELPDGKFLSDDTVIRDKRDSLFTTKDPDSPGKPKSMGSKGRPVAPPFFDNPEAITVPQDEASEGDAPEGGASKGNAPKSGGGTRQVTVETSDAPSFSRPRKKGLARLSRISGSDNFQAGLVAKEEGGSTVKLAAVSWSIPWEAKIENDKAVIEDGETKVWYCDPSDMAVHDTEEFAGQHLQNRLLIPSSVAAAEALGLAGLVRAREANRQFNPPTDVYEQYKQQSLATMDQALENLLGKMSIKVKVSIKQHDEGTSDDLRLFVTGHKTASQAGSTQLSVTFNFTLNQLFVASQLDSKAQIKFAIQEEDLLSNERKGEADGAWSFPFDDTFETEGRSGDGVYGIYAWPPA